MKKEDFYFYNAFFGNSESKYDGTKLFQAYCVILDATLNHKGELRFTSDINLD